MILKNYNIELNLLKFYTKCFKKNIFLKKFKSLYFSIFTHKKLMYFRYFFNKKYYITSCGQLLKKNLKTIKFFKKSPKVIGVSINTFHQKFKNNFKNIYIFFCKNFNYKHYIWLKKYAFLIKPNFEYFIITYSWNYITKRRKRIKKKIFKNLFKKNVSL